MKTLNICPRCGLPIESKMYHLTSGPYEHLCERCWSDKVLNMRYEPNKSFLHIVTTQIVTFIRDDSDKFLHHKRSEGQASFPLREEVKTNMEQDIEIEVIRFEQKGMPMYQGRMKARDLLATWHVEEWKDEVVGRSGYQRQLFEDRCRDIAKYLLNCDVAIIPPILASLREGFEFEPKKGNIGVLRIPREKGAITIIDGQHRVGGFQPIAEEVEKTGVDSPLLDYEVPVAFVDSATVAKRASEVAIDNGVKKMAADPLNVESAFFFIINRLAKQVRPSHRDVLQYRIFATGIRGIPIITKELWKIPIVPTVFRLHLDEDSPLKGMINLADIRGLQRPLHLSTFVKSLQPLFGNDDFEAIRKEEGLPEVEVSPKQLAFIKSYWNVVRTVWENAFANPTNYILLRAIGVYSLNNLMNDIYTWCREKGLKEIPSEDDIQEYLGLIKEFNWDRKTSLMGALGGMKGAKEAHAMLLAALAVKGVKETEERLKSLGLSDTEIESLRLRASEALKAS